MFEADRPIIRRKYYIMSSDNDWFIQVDDADYSFTSEIEVALDLYDKDRAFKICDLCNEKGMNVKVIKIEVKYSLWNESITR